ncbi:MAG: amidohydrolase family protein [Planctomycetota bacterium]|nr:amidohydrolase family protein [Planctomycetota bacterium]MDA1249430.1 amidohydrolase family protein [Planctomycetota bacterium]
MSSTIQAIDVHAHYGTYRRDEGSPLLNGWISADAATVVDRARRASVRLTVVSPLSGLLPRGKADTVAANIEASKIVRQTPGLLQWVIVHPHQPDTFLQAEELLSDPLCVGIKIHPEEHQYEIREHGARLFELAARHDAVVLAHSGDPFSWPQDFLPFADAHPNVRLILAHLGNGGGAAGSPDLQVRAIRECRHDNIFVDTSSARSILPGLVEWAVSEIGSKRILFGTDTPLYSTAMQRARIDSADISDDQKADILFRNAEQLLGLDPA